MTGRPWPTRAVLSGSLALLTLSATVSGVRSEAVVAPGVGFVDAHPDWERGQIEGGRTTEPIMFTDDSGRRRWQVVPATDPITGERLPMLASAQGGANWTVATVGPGAAPRLIDLDDIVLEVRPRLARFDYRLGRGGGALGDFNGDGVTDLAWSEDPIEFPTDLPGWVAIVFGEPGGRGLVDLAFDEPDAKIVTRDRYHPYGLMVSANINGDAYSDLVVRSTGPESRFEVHLGPIVPGELRDMARVQPDGAWLNDVPPIRMHAGDVNGDGFDDIVYGTSLSAPVGFHHQVAVIFGSERPRDLYLRDAFGEGFMRLDLPFPRPFGSVDVVDLDGDGRAEIVAGAPAGLRVLPDAVRAPGILAWEEIEADVVLVPELPFRSADIPSGCPTGGAVAFDHRELGAPDVWIVEARPRAFWSSFAEPDLRAFVPPGPWTGGSGGDDDTVVGDFNGDGHRDVAVRLPNAGDPSGSVRGAGIVLAASLGPNAWGELDMSQHWTRTIEPGPEEKGPRSLHVGDFDGDGTDDLLVVLLEDGRGLNGSIFRAYRGGPRFGPPSGFGCEELVGLGSGESATLDGASASAVVGAWGSIESPHGRYDPALQRAPLEAPAVWGDPVLRVDGQHFGELVSSSPEDAPRGYRGRVERGAARPLEVEVPFVAAPDGAHYVCLEPRNLAPLVEAGEDQSAATGPDDVDCAAVVRVSGLTYELQCDPLDLWWELDGRPIEGATSAEAELSMPVGVHELTLVAWDGFDQGRDSLLVNVVDTTPPRLSAELAVPDSWPPNHRLVELRLGRELLVDAWDNCDPSPRVRLLSVESDEGELARGSGHHAPDIVDLTDESVWLRVERSGRGEGRTHALILEAKDEAGNASTSRLDIRIAHDRRGRR